MANWKCFLQVGFGFAQKPGRLIRLFRFFTPDFANPIFLLSGFPLFLSGTRVCVSESQCAVTAIDNDGPDSPAGQITYSIVSTNNKFVIDKDTGVLSTNAVSQRCIHHSEGRDLLTISMVSHKCNHDSM